MLQNLWEESLHPTDYVGSVGVSMVFPEAEFNGNANVLDVSAWQIATGCFKNEGVWRKPSFALAVCILHFTAPLALTGAKQDLIHGLRP